MVKSVINLGVAAAISLSSFGVAAPAFAHGNGDGRYYERSDRGYNGDDGYYQNVRHNDQHRYDDRGRYNNGRYNDGRYNDRGYEPAYDSRDAEYRDPRRCPTWTERRTPPHFDPRSRLSRGTPSVP